MKQIKIRNCGTCPFNQIHFSRTSDLSEWDDYCIILNKHVNPNIIDEDCTLDNFKEEEN